MPKDTFAVKIFAGRVFFIVAGLCLSWAVYLGVYAFTAVSLDSYGPDSVHYPLTEASVEFFNSHHPDQKIDLVDREYIMDGSAEEDHGYSPNPSFRWLHHFYDPVHDAPLSLPFATKATTWAHNSILQSAYSGGSHIWEDALWHWQNGNKKEALRDLGHILHLVQDMAVPAHTRDDPHPPKAVGFFIGDENSSPYEKWTADKVEGEYLGLGKKLAEESNKDIPQFSSVEAVLTGTAEFTNKNFFSEDTIDTRKYTLPANLRMRQIDGRKSVLLGTVNGFEIPLVFVERQEFNNFLKTTDHKKVLSPYWDILSEHATVQGAALIELFFEQAKEREITERPPRFYDSIFAWLEKWGPFLYAGPEPPQETEKQERLNKNTVFSDAFLDWLENRQTAADKKDGDRRLSRSSVSSPGSGTGGPVASTEEEPSEDQQKGEKEHANKQGQDQKQYHPTGGGSPGGSDVSGEQAREEQPSEQQSSRDSSKEGDKDNTQETSTGTEDSRDSQDGSDDNQNEFNNQEGEQNENNTTTPLSVHRGEVVINEVAWMGTKASSADEWIELYNTNNTTTPFSLEGWQLETGDGNPSVSFGKQNEIKGEEFFLLERTDDTTVANHEADKIYTGALNNSGEKLTLRDDKGLVVDEVPLSSNTSTPVRWLAGGNDTKRSMERIDPEASGADPGNWQTYHGDGYTDQCEPGAYGAADRAVLGTPGVDNSSPATTTPSIGPTFLAATTTITGEEYWCSRGSPYYLEFTEDDRPTIAKGGHLRIFEDTSVKFQRSTTTSFTAGSSPHTGLDIQGDLTVLGEINPGPARFQYPDSLTWDKNNQGRLNMLRAGTSSSVVMESAELDGNFTNASSSVILLENNATSTRVTASTFKNGEFGVRAMEKGSGGFIEDSIFSKNKYPAQLRNSTLEFSGNKGSGNEVSGFYYPAGSNIPNEIRSDMTWHNNDLPYVLESNANDQLAVAGTSTLTVKSGVTVRSETSGPYYALSIKQGAKLQANGTSGDPIVFTANTNNPQAGDWRGLKILGGADLEHVRLEYGGRSGGKGGVIFAGTDSDVTLASSTIRKSASSAIFAKDADITIKNDTLIDQATRGFRLENNNGNTVKVMNTTFENIQRQAIQTKRGSGGELIVENSQFSGVSGSRFAGIKTSNSEVALTIENSSFDTFDSPISSNPRISATNVSSTALSLNGIQINGDLNTGESATWSDAGVPYLPGQTFINSSSTLEILAGAAVKPLNSFYPLFTVRDGGELNMKGSSSTPVTITSLDDDSAGGDVRGDGTSTVASPGDWNQVLYKSGAQGELTGAEMRYGGNGFAPTLRAKSGANVTSTNVIIKDSQSQPCQPKRLCN